METLHCEGVAMGSLLLSYFLIQSEKLMMTSRTFKEKVNILSGDIANMIHLSFLWPLLPPS